MTNPLVGGAATDVERATAIARAAAQWRDPDSLVRRRARAALAGAPWSPAVVESALAGALDGLHETSAAGLALPASTPPVRALAILPGNVIGPALASAFCGALAGARTTLKMSGAERALGAIAAEQFEAFGHPLAGLVRAEHWHGGDVEREARAFVDADVVVAFGDDDTLDDIGDRLPPRVRFIRYGAAYGLGLVMPDAGIDEAAAAAAIDVAMFDQRGCMSPQTIYVVGTKARAAAFGAALASELDDVAQRLPCARPESGEAAAFAEAIRRARLRSDDVHLGAGSGERLAYLVSVEPFGPPIVAGFGRIVAVKPAADAAAVAQAVRDDGRTLDTVGVGGTLEIDVFAGVALSSRALGRMQRPPFGYRPRISDFA